MSHWKTEYLSKIKGLRSVPNNHLAYQAIKENVTLINIIEHTNRNMDHRIADL
jgi:hypothetical protein